MTDAEAMLQDCLKRYKKLTDWEIDFISSLEMKKTLDNLTDRQYEILEKIWEKVA